MDHIHRLITEGEHQRLDFKFEISDARRIARSFAAFANTDGGRLLIGVKDNGAIAGIRSDEEFYMIESAAKVYCRPEVNFTFSNWIVEKKTVMEVIVPPSPEKPHFAETRPGEWHAYIRVNDQNFIANRILLRVWKGRTLPRGVYLPITDAEKSLLRFLDSNPEISLSKFMRIAGIKRNRAENILVKLLLLDILEMRFTENQVFYKLKTETK